jgi:hypothetical protein
VSDAELIVRLEQLAPELDFPPTPDLRPGVRARLEQPRRSRRRWLVVALAVLAVAVAGVLAVPPARTAILEWLGIEGVKLSFVDRLPTKAVRGPADLGGRVSPGQAQARAGFRIVTPPGSLGTPRVYFREPPVGGLVTFLYGTPARARLLLSELDGDYRPFLEKTIGQSTNVEEVDVDGEPAVWIEGTHGVEYADANGNFGFEPVRLAGRVLLWQQRGVTFRLEGALTRDQALRIARALT